MLFLFNVKMRCTLLSWEAREGDRQSLSLNSRGVAPPKTSNLTVKIVSQTVEWDCTSSVTLSPLMTDYKSALAGGHVALA